jgi:protein SCO1/2
VDSGVRNTLFGITAFIAAILGLLVASILMPKPMSDEEAAKIGLYRFDQPRVLMEFAMKDHLGNDVGLDALRGSWSIVFFGFTTCPDICPTTLSVLAEAVKPLEEAPRVIMVSVDPDRDTPQKMQQYVPAFHPDFIGFSGNFEQTVRLAEQVNVAFGKVPGATPGSYLVDHSASLVLIDPEGRYAGFIKSPHSTQKIRQAIRELL